MVLVQVGSAYAAALVHSPIPTKAVTAALVGLTGDALAQRSDAAVDYDVRRACSFALFGAGYTGAFQHSLFGWLSGSCSGSTLAGIMCEDIGAAALGSPWLAAAEMTLVNQLCVVPFLYLPLFFLLSGLAKRTQPCKILSDARSLYVPTLVRNWSFWLPVQCALFALLPAELLVPATCLAGVAWNFILSSLASTAIPLGAARAPLAHASPAHASLQAQLVPLT